MQTRRYRSQSRQPLQEHAQLLTPEPAPKSLEEQRLLSIATAYFRRLSFYEAEICSAMSKDRPCPASMTEQRRCDNYAEYVIYDLCQKNGLSRLEFLETIRRYAAEALL